MHFVSLYNNRSYDTRIHHILELPRKNFMVKERCKLSNYGDLKNIFVVEQGYWRVAVNKFISENRLDFAISVAAAYQNNIGHVYRFLPGAIQHDLCSTFGKETYLNWKKLVLGDIESLHHLVKVARQKITRVIPSVTCSDRSVRLCERLGLPVEQGLAFLVPETNDT